MKLLRDTGGQALLEAVIVLPVLIVFTLVTMEFCMMSTAKQLANYAAYCAARTAAVQGIDQAGGQKSLMAAALALSCISPTITQNATTILSAYGVSNPSQLLTTTFSIPGFSGDVAKWSSRLASSYIRTCGLATHHFSVTPPAPVLPCDTATSAGMKRKHVTADLVYIYHCTVFPLGTFWGHSELTTYITYLQGLSSYYAIQPIVTSMQSAWSWNVPIHGHAVMDYWAN